jgi:hypothetical protein
VSQKSEKKQERERQFEPHDGYQGSLSLEDCVCGEFELKTERYAPGMFCGRTIEETIYIALN